MLFSTSLMSLMVGICMHAQISAKSQSHSSRPVAQGFVPKPAYKLFNLLDNKQQSTKTPAGTSKLRLVQASETKGAGRPSQLKDGGNTGSTQVVSFNRKPEVNPQSSSGTLRDDPEQTQKSVNIPVYNTALEAKMETIQLHTLPVSPLEEYDRQEYYDLTDNLKNDALDALPKDADRNDAMPAPGSGRSRSTETEIEINIPTASALQTSNPDDKTTTRTGLQTEQNLRSHEGITMKSNGINSDVIADENVIYSGAPRSGTVFRADRQHKFRTLQEGVAQANASFPISIQTRSGGCSMPAVLGGGDTLPWTCRQSQQWRYLGENVYPSRLYETVCEGSSCWYGHYNCSPIYYTLHVLKTCGQRCNDQRVPYPLRSRWQWLSYNVTVGCQCVR